MKIMLEPGAKCPTRGTPGSAGWDLYAHRIIDDPDHNCRVYCTGVHVEIPHGYVGLLLPRSSGFKLDLRMLTGVIDSDFRGEIRCIMDYHTIKAIPEHYIVGDRIAQLVIVKLFDPDDSLVVADILSDTTRGEGGFGSTGR